MSEKPDEKPDKKVEIKVPSPEVMFLKSQEIIKKHNQMVNKNNDIKKDIGILFENQFNQDKNNDIIIKGIVDEFTNLDGYHKWLEKRINDQNVMIRELYMLMLKILYSKS